MKVLKRILCMILCVLILSGSVGTKYFDANHMERVDAAAEAVAVGLSATALYAICFYVGTVAYAHAPIETSTLSDDQIASMGYSTITYMTASNLLGIPAAPNAPLIGFVDKAGQSYVFGAEAFKAVAETSFQVIQGGKKPDDDDDDEEGGIIDNLIKFPGNAKSLYGVCTAAFAGMLGSVIKGQYDKFMNGEESIYSSLEVLQTVTDADIAAQWSGEEFYYSFSGTAVRMTSQGTISCTDSISSYRTADFPIAGYITKQEGAGGTLLYSVWFCSGSKAGICPFSADVTRTWSDGSTETSSTSYQSGFGVVDLNAGETLVYGANFPIFSTEAAARSYLNGKIPATDALNYSQSYRIADWLADDWAGVLLDPLTGLLALGDWANIARHQGLSALGNELDLASFLNYLRDFFANLGSNPGTDPQPVVDPAKAPILYPSGDADNALDPDTDIDPVRDPVISPDPSIKPAPKPDPKPDPDPDPGTDPDPDPDPGVTPLPDMDAADYRVELSCIFPFCIPFDFVALLKTLDAEPRAPCFTFPVVIPALSYREDVKLDLAIFDDVAKVIRLCEKVSFILFLMFVTSKVIRW